MRINGYNQITFGLSIVVDVIDINLARKVCAMTHRTTASPTQGHNLKEHSYLAVL